MVRASWHRHGEMLGQVILRYMQILILVKDRGNIGGDAIGLV